MAVIECDNCGAIIPDRAVGSSSRLGVVRALCPDCSPTGNYEIEYEPVDLASERSFDPYDEHIARYTGTQYMSTEVVEDIFRAVVQDEEDTGSGAGEWGAMRGKTTGVGHAQPDKGTSRGAPTVHRRNLVKSPARTRRPTKRRDTRVPRD